MNQTWEEAQKWEKDWHGNCVNSLGEELKQLTYAKKIGLNFASNGKTPFNIDLQGKSILDIGGGAYSLLLKCSNFKRAIVAEPIDHPLWVMERYKSAGIEFLNVAGEDLETGKTFFDEVWIYNVLQHVKNPEKIIQNARKLGKLIRIFEWIEIPVSPGHLHVLTEENLNLWLGGEGKTEVLNENGCNGKSYYGVFLP